MHMANLFSNLPEKFGQEAFETLIEQPKFLLERIVSQGQTTPPGQWFDQDRDEWVVLLTGSATIRFETEDVQVALWPGDYLRIPAHCRHRVERTDADQPTIWLALHFAPEESAGEQ